MAICDVPSYKGSPSHVIPQRDCFPAQADGDTTQEYGICHVQSMPAGFASKVRSSPEANCSGWLLANPAPAQPPPLAWATQRSLERILSKETGKDIDLGKRK